MDTVSHNYRFCVSRPRSGGAPDRKMGKKGPAWRPGPAWGHRLY